MRRDMDLCRRILFQVEEFGEVRREALPEAKSPEEVTYHIRLLRQGGLIDGAKPTMDLAEAFPKNPLHLTMAGHDFLDAARSDTVWNNVKEQVKEKGAAVPFDVLKGLLVAGTAALFGLK